MSQRWRFIIGGLAGFLLFGCQQAPSANDDGDVSRPQSASPNAAGDIVRATDEDLTGYVDPFIGTSNFGATHPGAIVPHGLASVAPFNVAFSAGGLNPIEKDSRWHSTVYVDENKFLTGFSHLNLSGVGCPDAGVLLAMPTVGEMKLDPAQYGSTYSEQEARPGYYAVTLDNGVKVEATATTRSARTRYSFPSGVGSLIFNLGTGLTNETGANIRLLSATEFEGSRMIGDFCYSSDDVRPVYFAARLTTPAAERGLYKKAPNFKGVEGDWIAYNGTYKPYRQEVTEVSGDDIGAFFTYEDASAERVELQVGISFVSTKNAWENLETEQADRGFDEISGDARQSWNEMLQRIRVEGRADQKEMFYTALYHALIHPSVFQDVNGEYVKPGGGVGVVKGDANRYTVFSLWDTYRNVHAFLSLVYPERQLDMVRSMIEFYKEGGWLPKWELYGMETDVMVGDPALPVIADTYLRGIRDFDVETAYEAMKKHASLSGDANAIRPFSDDYLELGFIPLDVEGTWGGSVSSSIEYAIADWSLSRLAEALGRADDAEAFNAQSLRYRTYFDPKTLMLRPKNRDGSFYEAFDPEQGKNFEPVPGFVEGTAWNYRFYAPHDLPWLIEQNGGAEGFVRELDKLFETDNFDMANEPDINYPFLYNYAPGHEYKSAERVSELIDAHYGIGPDGLPGNDDAGTLSTWLLFSMMGLYPVVPGEPSFAVFSPQLEAVDIALHPAFYDGETVSLRRVGDALRPTAEWNGKPVNRFFLEHSELVAGGTLTFKQDAPVREGDAPE